MKHLYSDIAITGFSAVSAAGIGVEPVLDLVRAGGNALRPIPSDVLGSDRFSWGKADGFKASEFMPPMKARKMDRCSQFAVATAGLALKDAGIDMRGIAPERVGIVLGSGFCGVAVSAEFLTGYFNEGSDGLVPMIFPNTVPNAPASYASIEHGFKGPNVTLIQRFCSAESALLLACRFVEEGRADVMLVGGTDDITPLLIKAFAAMGQMRIGSAPFGEGCGILVIERGSHALQRGAVIRGMVECVRSIGRLVPGHEEQGLELLIGIRPNCSQFSLSGCAADIPELVEPSGNKTVLNIGCSIGRSLAMGGLSMSALVASLSSGEHGMHVAASPQGPYFAVDIMGGSSV